MGKLETVFSMKGGKGESSYMNNSHAQARHARSMLHFLEATIDGIQLLNASALPFAIADLGCSSGNNTLFVVDTIINRVIGKHEALGHEVPEFQVFFSDLQSNDFNVLFQLLCPLSSNSIGECLAGANQKRAYYAAGVPGSFYGRLFPSRSIDVFHSTFSLHWLSEVPNEVADKRSEAYNRERVFIHGEAASAARAYKQQFQSDLASFLRARACEMKHGGAMFLACVGRTTLDPTDQGGAGLLFGTHFEDSWEDLVREGLLDKEKRDSFNVPMYAPSLQDFKEVVESNGAFIVNKLDIVRGGSPLVVNNPDDAAEVGKAFANSCRSLLGVLVDAHIGDRLGEELFERVEQRATSSAKQVMEQLQFDHIVASLSFP